MHLGGLPPLRGPRHEQEFQICLRTFWLRIRLAPLADPLNQPGTTWIDLFTWFTIMGGRVHAAQQPDDFSIKPKLLKLQRIFNQQSRQLFKLATTDTSCLLRASPSRARPLKQFGSESFMLMISCRMALDQVQLKVA